jgi:hypothetical protein
MKKYYLVAFLLIVGVFASLQVQAQRNASVNKNVFKINPLSLATLTLNVGYERMISHSSALQLGVFYSGMSFGGIDYSGFGITPEVRLYIFGAKNTLQGFHVSPFVRFQNFNLEVQGFSESADKLHSHSLGAGALLGYQWLLGRNENISLDLFAGPMLMNTKIDFKGFMEGEIDPYGIPSDLALRSGMTLGIAF